MSAAPVAVPDPGERARAVAAQVPDPELPVLTLADLGILRGVEVDGAHRVRVSITPTYSGCPALDTMRDELHARLREAGFAEVEVRTVLSPAWSTDWITERGRRLLAEHGIAPPTRDGHRVPGGPVALTLDAPPPVVPCPRCGCAGTVELSRFGPTPCTALRRCPECGEPFEHVKEI